MKAWSPVIRMARRSLYLLGVLILLSTVAVVGLRYWADNLKTTFTQLESSTQELQIQLDAKRDDLHNMRDHIARFEGLQKQGFVGAPDRAQWVEQLQASYQSLGLGGRISYQLQAPKTLGQEAALTDAAPVDATLPQSHDLKFELHGVHELDVLNLIQSYRSQVRGRFRVNACTLQDPKETGLSAQCELRFITVPLPPPADGAATPTPAVAPAGG